MIYVIRWHPNAEAFLKKLPAEIARRIVRKLDRVAHVPFRFLEHYEGQDFYKLRIGDYRALIDVDMENKILFVQVVGHRKNIYERLK